MVCTALTTDRWSLQKQTHQSTQKHKVKAKSNYYIDATQYLL